MALRSSSVTPVRRHARYASTRAAVAAQSSIDRVRRQPRLESKPQGGARARPDIPFRCFDYRCANRVEVDVLVEGQNVAFGIDEARTKASLPARAGAPMVPMVPIEFRHVALVE